MPRLLIHICCAPCAVHPISLLQNEGIDVTGFWFNPNIHPFLEFKKRLLEVQRLAKLCDFTLIENDSYEIGKFLKAIINASDTVNRCDVCYEYRLAETAKFASENGFDSFTTTLLHSKYQQHESIREIGENLANEFNIEFLYRDFRHGWSKGLDLSRKFKLYRQQYCGCIFSEYERFHDTADKVLDDFEWQPRRKESGTNIPE